jgi:hypothetical protein
MMGWRSGPHLLWGEGSPILAGRDRRRKPRLSRTTLYRMLLTNVVSEGFIQPMQQVAARNASIADMAALPDNLPFVVCAGCGQVNEAYPQRSKLRHSSRVACFRLSFVRRSRDKASSPASIANGPSALRPFLSQTEPLVSRHSSVHGKLRACSAPGSRTLSAA